MSRKRSQDRQPSPVKTVAIPAELYKVLSHEAIDLEITLREHTQNVLARALGRVDLVTEATGARLDTAPAR